MVFTCTKDDTLSISSVEIYDSDGTTKVWSDNGPYITETSKTYKPAALEAGTYYMKVVRYSSYYGGYSIVTGEVSGTTTSIQADTTTITTTTTAPTTTVSTTTVPETTSTTTMPEGDLVISGTVYGDAIEHVAVYLYGASDGVVETDADGNFSFYGLEQGTYTVIPVLGRVSFDPPSQVIELTDQDEISVEFISRSAAIEISEASASPSEAPDDASTKVSFTATVTPAGAAVVSSVTIDLTPIGGSSDQSMYDDGSNGDMTAGDGVYSFQSSVAAGTPPAMQGLVVRASDDITGMTVEKVIKLDVFSLITDTVSDSTDSSLTNGIEGQTLVLRISLSEEENARVSITCSVLLDILKPDSTIYKEDIPVTREETEVQIENAETGEWTYRVKNSCTDTKNFSISTASSGTGIISGVIINAETGEGLDGVMISTNSGGSTISSEGSYVMLHVAGVCTVSPQTSHFIPTSRSLSVISGGVSTLDFTLFPSDSVDQDDDDDDDDTTTTTSIPAGDDDDDNDTGPDPVRCLASYLLGEGDPRLETIRRFRDEVLATNTVGKIMIKQFYKKDKQSFAMLEKSPILRAAAKKLLESLIPAMELLLKE